MMEQNMDDQAPEPYDDPLPVSEWEEYGDEEPDEDYAAMPEMGTCDADGCMIMYEVTSTFDHCAEEGRCWGHCTDAPGHAFMYGLAYDEIKEAFLPEVVDPGGEAVAKLMADLPALIAFQPIKYKFEQPKIEDLDPVAPPQYVQNLAAKFAALDGPPDAPELPGGDFDINKTLAFVNEAIEAGPNNVFMAAKGVLEQVMVEGYVPTSAERAALFVAGLEAIAYAEHGQVVAITEGRTLAKHRADFADHECGVCENLDSYANNALELLKPIAAEQVMVMAEQQTEQQRAALGQCVDCGEKPANGRIYSLEAGKGFMCSRCAGPYLMMDDGNPGDPWPEAEGE